MVFNMSELATSEIYRLLVGGVTPRPIAWISTLSKEGIANIAPYSFLMLPVVILRFCGIRK